MSFLNHLRKRLLRVERDANELREDMGKPYEDEKQSVMQRLRSLEDVAAVTRVRGER